MFVNLPVQNLEKSAAFFSRLGFSFDPEFTDENATCMVVNDQAYVMLLREPYFQTFSHKPVPDTARHSEVIVSFMADSRARVDELVDLAVEAGGRISGDPVDMQGMYSRGFEDPDGHLWEFGFMDLSAREESS
jgi:predicted lactoylglutathione lyase